MDMIDRARDERVNIHRWHDGTLRALLAERLNPDLSTSLLRLTK